MVVSFSAGTGPEQPAGAGCAVPPPDIASNSMTNLTSASGRQAFNFEKCDLHQYARRTRTSVWKSRTCGKCPCCRNELVLKVSSSPQQSATAAKASKKRKRVSTHSPSTPSEDPRVPNETRWLQSAIADEDLPKVSYVPPSPPATPAPLQPDSPVLRIHNHSAEDYQQLYHEVVDDMLKYKSGRTRPYSLQLGRCIKQKLWERLNRPVFSTSTNEHNLTQVEVSYGEGVHPPLFNVDMMGEPSPNAKR